LLVGAGIAYCL